MERTKFLSELHDLNDLEIHVNELKKRVGKTEKARTHSVCQILMTIF